MFKKMIAVALSALIATSVMPLSAFAAEISDSSEAVAAVDAGSLPTEKELVGAEEQTAAPEVTEEVTSLPAEKNPTEPITEKQTEAPVEPTTAEAPAQPEKEKDAETVGAAIESDEAVGKSSFTYSVSNNQVTITGLSDEYLTDLVIPDTIEDLPVTTIKENAFNGCSQVTSITVPNSVTSIGVGAFKGTNPTKVTLPFIGSNRTATNQYAVFGYIFGYTNDNISGTTYQYNNSSYYYYYYYIPKTIREVVITDVANIPNYAFYNCDWIESIQVNEEIKTIGGSAFYNCAKLTQFEIPDAVEVISSYVFSDCMSLETVDLPASLMNINEYAFNNCSALNIPDLVIPDGVTSIGSYAFSGCSKVTSITVPNSVTSIGNGAFKGTNPTKATLPFIGSSRTATNQYAVFGYIFGYTNDNISGTTYQYNNSSYYYYYYYIPKTIREVVITDAANIPNYAFYNCDWIESIQVNEEIKTIGGSAFYNCAKLTQFEIPDAVEVISSYVFSDCMSLETVNLPASLMNINEYAFNNCSALNIPDLVIPDGVTSIGSYAFSGCDKVTSITVPNSVTSIGNGAFKGTNPTKVTLPFIGSNRTATNQYAVFGYIFGYTNDNISGITYQYNNSSYYYYYYYIPKTIREVVITDAANIPNYAFYNCDWIESIQVNEEIKTIGGSAFYNCAKLTQFEIPDAVEVISSYAFSGCTSLETVNLPASLTQIGSYAFSGCTSLKTVDLPASLTNINEYAFNNCSALNIPDLVIPDGVTSIGSYAFSGCDKVTSITVPNSVTSIGNGAFKGTNPTKVTLPFIGSSRTATNQSAVFGNIFGYTNDNISGTTYQYNNSSYYYYYYYIPKSIREVVITDAANIPNYAFYNCDWIESIQVNEEIKTIGGSAFYNCAKLTQFEIPDAVEVISSYAFSGCTSLETVDLPASLTQIGSYAFSGCTSLKTVDLPASLTNINEYAFNNCSVLNIPDLVIPDGVTSIGSYAFSGCDKVTSITVPNNVTSIGSGAFKGTNPTKVTLPFIGSSRTATNQSAVFGNIFGYTNDNISGTTYQYNNSSYYYYYYYIPNTIKEVVITDAATVPYHAFYNCDWIEKVTINDIEGDASLVGSDAFYNCKVLTVYINRDTAVHTYCERNGIRHCSTKSLTLEKDSLTLFRNETGTIGSEVILLNDKVDNDPETVWTSSDPEVAKVDRYTGVISAVAPGTATITADSEGVTATAQVTVYFKLEGITLNKTTTEIDIDKTETLTVIYDPDNTTDSREISWASSDDSIASVDENGVVTAHKKGNATITATGFGDVQASCTVQVLVPMTAITFDNSTITIPRGTRQKVPFTVSPSDTTDTYTVTSSDTNVATVDRFGNVTAKKIGTAVITVQSSRGLEQTCVITVNSPASSIIISDESKNLFVGKSFTLTTEMSPKDSTDSITWTSTNEDVAVVTPDGQVTAIAKGSATIIATADSGVSAVCEVSAESDISTTTIYLAYQETEYDGSEKLPEVSVYYNGEKLVENTDYVLAYLNNLNAGDASVYVTSLYDGTDAERKFTINPLTIKALDISYKSTMTYTGSPLEALEEITYQSLRLTEGTDYKVRYENNTGAGPATMTVTGMGNFCDSTTKTYTIAPKSANLLTVMLSESSYIYDGNAKTPEVTVKDGNKTLAERTDYNVSYSKNIHAGDAVVTVTGLNNYGSATTVGFKIYPKSISNVTVRLDKTVFAYDGTEKCPVTRVEDNGIELTESVDYRVEYKENQEAGTATATIIGQNDYTGTLATEFSIIQLGDIDRNGIVNIQDVTVLQRHLAEFVNNDGTPIVDEDDAEILKIADVDHSETITISDVTTIQRYLAEIIDSF